MTNPLVGGALQAGNQISSHYSKTPLRIGSVEIGGTVLEGHRPFEAPNGFEEGLGDLGAKQKAVYFQTH